MHITVGGDPEEIPKIDMGNHVGRPSWRIPSNGFCVAPESRFLRAHVGCTLQRQHVWLDVHVRRHGWVCRPAGNRSTFEEAVSL